jgi:hypothetical protein
MSTLTILIIRHAEKQGESWPGSGLTSDGLPDKKSLVIRGWQRAGSWCGLFGVGLGGLDYPAPSVIYAADPNATSGDDPSQRPYETVIPVAARLGLEVNTNFAVGQETQLVDTVLSQTGVALVAWEHKAIVHAILPAIVKDQPVAGLPSKWDGKRFDVVLRFDRTSPEAPWSFRQLCPCLLSDDSPNPMD